MVGVADTGAVDQAVDGVEHHAGAGLQSAVLQLHPIGLQDPDTAVDLGLGVLDAPELLHQEGHHVHFHGGTEIGGLGMSLLGVVHQVDDSFVNTGIVSLCQQHSKGSNKLFSFFLSESNFKKCVPETDFLGKIL